MALILQTDDGTIANANAYIDHTFFATYFADRNPTALSDGSWDDATVDIAAISATDYADTRWKFSGKKLTGATQSTQFPRDELYDADWNVVTGVPVLLKRAIAEYMLRILQNQSALAPDPTVDASAQRVAKTTETLGPITETIEYVPNLQPSLFRSYPAADILLRGYIRNTQGRVIR